MTGAAEGFATDWAVAPPTTGSADAVHNDRSCGQADEDQVAPSSRRIHTVLIVEDDLVIQSLVSEVLSDAGYEIVTASNGREGVTLARSHLPSVILMDINMPVLSGDEAIDILKSDPATSWIPIVAMSAGSRLLHHAVHLQADGLLGKPFDIDVLLAQVALRVHLVRRPASNEFDS